MPGTPATRAEIARALIGPGRVLESAWLPEAGAPSPRRGAPSTLLFQWVVVGRPAPAPRARTLVNRKRHTCEAQAAPAVWSSRGSACVRGCVGGARWRRRARVRRWRRARAAGGATARSTSGPTSASCTRRIRAVTSTLRACSAATAMERAGLKVGETARRGLRRGRRSANEHPRALRSPSPQRPIRSVCCRRRRSASLRPEVPRVRLRRRRAAR